MGLETSTFISGLTASWPVAADPKSQGDDHLRLIKAALQNTFPTANKAWYGPTTATKSADFSVLAADQNKTFVVDTTAGVVNMTLPSLVVGDAGWECWHVKSVAGVNPVMVKPPSGTLMSGSLLGLSAARRCIPGARIRSFWTGTSWLVSRADGIGGPIGSCIEYHGTGLPNGFEWPNGQTLASAATAYPEYNAVFGSGVTLDKRARVGLPLDNLGGSAAGRLGGGIITGTAIGNVGGADTVALTAALIPNLTSTNPAQPITVNGANVNNSGTDALFVGGGAGHAINNAVVTPSFPSSGNNAISVTSSGTGGASPAHGNLQPSIMVGQVLVVE